MLRYLMLVVALLAGGAAGTVAGAGDLPALFRVTEVAADDVLNIRAAPNARAAIIGTFAPDAAGIEVVALSPDGRWGQVNSGEQAGWSSMRYLTPRGGPGWQSGAAGLICFGTEPFWNVRFFLPGHRAEFFTPDNDGVEWVVEAGALPATAFPPTLALPFSGADTGMAVIRPAACNDGMSDMAFGLEMQVYFRGDPAGLSGCCTLAP